MFVFCGFNGFKQLKAFYTEEKYDHSYSINELILAQSVDLKCDVSFSWSNVLLLKDGNIILSGFVNGKISEPVIIDKPFIDSIVQASCGRKCAFFVTANGQCWQYNFENGLWKNISNFFVHETEQGTESKAKVIKMCHGETLTVALSNSGVAYCLPNVLNTPGVFIKNVDCGKEHGILLSDRGAVYTWGGGSRGQLGQGDLESSDTPQLVEALAGLTVVKISAGGWHSAVVTDQGDLYTWGWNKQGQLGLPTLTDGKNGVAVSAVPQPVDLPLPIDATTVVDVSCGASHTIIKLNTGEIVGCGYNKWGQLGLKDVEYADQMRLLPLPRPELAVLRIVCGPWNTLLICHEKPSS